MWQEAASLAVDRLRPALRLSEVHRPQLRSYDAALRHLQPACGAQPGHEHPPLVCRDLDDIGASEIAIQPLNKLPYGKIDSCKPKFSDGVIFLTYSSLISSSDKVCLRSMLHWLPQAC